MENRRMDQSQGSTRRVWAIAYGIRSTVRAVEVDVQRGLHDMEDQLRGTLGGDRHIFVEGFVDGSGAISPLPIGIPRVYPATL